MFESNEEAIAGVERVEVAEVKQVFVVEESALPHYLLVVGVYFGQDHIDEHAATHQGEEGETEVSEGVRGREDDSSD